MIEPEDAAITVKDRAKEKLRRDLGPLIENALNDPKTVEIMLNADGRLWQERLGETMHCIGNIVETRAESIIKTVAGFHGKEVTRFNPILEGELPIDGSRFAGQLPPIVSKPTFAIRKKAISVFSLEDYVQAQIMTEAQSTVIKNAVVKHRNILVIGGTGSGKTTLVNAIIHEMVSHAPSERVFIIEDTGEIQCSAQNFVQYHTTIDVSMTQLLKTTLRMRPDRILVGEVRGSEALDLLDAWNTGHEGGAATLHANNCLAGLQRLKSLISRNPAAPADIEPLIGEAVHCVVHIARTPTGRKVENILSIKGYENGQYNIETLI
ncbi:TPA: P-type conjugative transfer ATPase TrbB [Legionella pneumophila]|nr:MULTISPECIES: P-type conjugative transfer ATPase TrbB [Legionella]MBN5936079.1 P-type conjugative transfer ATPase TrbB [Legionella anisa]HAT1130446.1 P-type conjugative transfer ATPase TrbB [Legionella pneumophila]HAT1919956.1 P-type conjugative transfer ATPase TrbB [Legionella pneumophila]HAT4006278.1 P-type conjugative transfer ATPase TrbB [Legionella pneumophila]HAT4453490.1 P-type conjugative transfer ATPase TrbB [Legionella pneumophila]